MKKYRILDRGEAFPYRYAAEKKYKWWPFWISVGFVYRTTQDAVNAIENDKQGKPYNTVWSSK